MSFILMSDVEMGSGGAMPRLQIKAWKVDRRGRCVKQWEPMTSRDLDDDIGLSGFFRATERRCNPEAKL